MKGTKWSPICSVAVVLFCSLIRSILFMGFRIQSFLLIVSQKMFSCTVIRMNKMVIGKKNDCQIIFHTSAERYCTTTKGWTIQCRLGLISPCFAQSCYQYLVRKPM